MAEVGFIAGQITAPLGGQLVELFKFTEAAILLHHRHFKVDGSVFLLHEFFHPGHNRAYRHGGMACGFHHFATKALAVLCRCCLGGNGLVQVVLGLGCFDDLHRHCGISTRLAAQFTGGVECHAGADGLAESLIGRGGGFNLIAQCFGGFFSTAEYCGKSAG